MSIKYYLMLITIVSQSQSRIIVEKWRLISEDDWNAIQETLYLNSIEGMAESIIDGAETSLEDCIPEDMVEW